MSTAALYAAHHPYVRGVVRTLGVADADADDVVQEVFCVLLRRPPPAGEPRGQRRWLFQTARRVVSNHRRGQRRRALRQAHAWRPSEAACPEATAIDQQARRRLAREVAALPPEAQRLYQLSEVEGRPGPEVARRLGLNPNTTYARVRALRRRLLQVLVVLLLGLATLLASQVNCVVTERPSAALSRAPTGQDAEALDDRRRAPLRGPALGLGELAVGW